MSGRVYHKTFTVDGRRMTWCTAIGVKEREARGDRAGLCKLGRYVTRCPRCGARLEPETR